MLDPRAQRRSDRGAVLGQTAAERIGTDEQKTVRPRERLDERHGIVEVGSADLRAAVGEGEELFRAPRRRDDAARLGVEQEFHGAPAEVPGSSRDDQCSPTEIHDTATFPHATFSTIFPRA